MLDLDGNGFQSVPKIDKDRRLLRREVYVDLSKPAKITLLPSLQCMVYKRKPSSPPNLNIIDAWPKIVVCN
jgi:hypothetical protein